jgi:4'-phosphopantetheinyl transferase EntD
MLLPEEEAAVTGAVKKRRDEFACGRSCARRALIRMGLMPSAIFVGAGREPLWPPSITGSITHCDGYCAAAIASMRTTRSIGIDVERITTLEESLLHLIAAPAEQRHLMGLCQHFEGPWRTLFFSIKESLFKAWYPLTGSWLDFDQARVTFDPGTGEATLRVLHSSAERHRFPTNLTSRYCWDQDYVFSAVQVPALDDRSILQQ